MIITLKKTCKCGKIIDYEQQYCDMCMTEIEQKRKEYGKKYDKEVRYKRDKKYHDFYNSEEWNRVKTTALIRDKGLCQWCMKEGRIRPADVVHHIVEVKQDWSKRLNLDNLVSLCHECHNRHHNNYKGKINTKVYIVWGPPAGGKTTYVMKNKQHGDMVVDLDYIKSSISLEMNRDDFPDNLLDTAFLIRDYIYDLIINRQIEAKTIWVIAGLPERSERLQLYSRLKADGMIFIGAKEEECIQRVLKDESRKDKNRQIDIIRKWFSRFEG